MMDRPIRLILGFIVMFWLMGLQMGTVHAAPADLDRWIRDAASGPEPVRLHALTALGKSGDPRALAPLLTAVQDANPMIRERALQALQMLTQTLGELYHNVVQWIEAWLITLDAYISPPLPVERTRHEYRL